MWALVGKRWATRSEIVGTDETSGTIGVRHAAYVGRDCGWGRTVGAVTVGGMTPWAPIDKQAAGKPGRAG
jgi:hypothetical protein